VSSNFKDPRYFMKTFKKSLFFFALTGWTIAFVVNILSIFDIYISDTLPLENWLIPGLFIVWIATLISLKGEQDLKSENSSFNKNNDLFSMFNEIPNWLRALAVLSFIYTSLNFFLAFNPYTPEIDNGQFILMEKSEFIRILTEKEYIHYKANEVRLSTGHFLGFYGIASAFLFRNMKRN
jgi:hypothetical protein